MGLSALDDHAAPHAEGKCEESITGWKPFMWAVWNIDTYSNLSPFPIDFLFCFQVGP